MDSLRDQFLLDPTVIFLNHGSFGAMPKPVFAVYQEWQRRLERQPITFFQQDLYAGLRLAREQLAAYVGAQTEDIVFVHNATYGVNVIARSLGLEPGDEVLTTDHEYGACNNAWEFICGKADARYIRQAIAVPVTRAEEIVEQLWAGVTGRTRVIYLSHITSPTALAFPVAAICDRARASGILTVVDGAHAPGQIPIDLDSLGADFYVGNLHKWFCAPKGAGFLWVRRALQPMIEPLVVSWGYGSERNLQLESDFVSAITWQGTDDYFGYLSVPAAIAFQAECDWTSMRARCHLLLRDTLERCVAELNLTTLSPIDGEFYHQMAAVILPSQEDLPAFKQRLYDRHRIEIPCTSWHGRHLLRISVQGYNTLADLDTLIEALRGELA